MASGSQSGRVAVFAAIGANMIIALAKFGAAWMTGSASMLSEAFHSVVDTGNECLMLVGMRASARPPSAVHPFGYGKELYFWSLVVAMLLFGIGGGLSLLEGYRHVMTPETLTDPSWNYAVLGIALGAESTSLTIALRQLMKKRDRDQGLYRTFRASKDPSVFVVVAEDTAAVAGIFAAFAGVYLSQRLDAPWIDGAASLAIGAILIGVATILVIETRALLMGERADTALVHAACRIARMDAAVASARTPLTMQLGPDQVLLNMELRFRPGLTGEAVVAAVARIEKRIRTSHPSVRHIFIEAGGIGAPRGRP